MKGVSYNEKFAPDAKIVIVQTFLVVTSLKNWKFHPIDVHNVFLHGDLDDEVYMKLRSGLTSNDFTMVCRLRNHYMVYTTLLVIGS